MQGEYIEDRWIVGMIQSLCLQRGIEFSSWSDDWILELQRGDRIERVLGYRFGLNDSVAASISQDKVATYEVLAHHGMQAVPHVLVRTKISKARAEAMEGWHGVVVKPLVGTSGHGVRVFASTKQATAFVESSNVQAWAASPLTTIKREIRIIMLDGERLLAYEKQPVMIDGLEMFNLGLGATPKDIQPDAALEELARNAQRVLGLRLAAIDIIETSDGKYRVLEINDGIMMENYARAAEGNKKRAEEVYGAILDRLFE